MRTLAALSCALVLAAPASAQQTVEGIYRVVGTDAVGSYTGRVQLMDQGGWFHAIREVTYGTPINGKTVTLVWQGSGVTRAGGAELHVTYPLYRMGWITEAGGLQRTTADRQPDPVTGVYRRDPAGGLAGTFSSPGGVSVSEALTWTGAAGSVPIHTEDRTLVSVHNAPPGWLKTVLFALFNDYHQLPWMQPYAGSPEFQSAIHTEVRDRIGFDWLRAHPGELFLMNKGVDAISLAEGEVRANAYGKRLFQKAASFDADAEGPLLYEGILASGATPNPSVPGGYTKSTDMSSFLWTGQLLFAQGARYQLTQDPQVLANVERLADRFCDMIEIDPRPGEFARSLRPVNAGPNTGRWHAGSGQFAHLAYYDNGNNDMIKGFWMAFIAAWEVLPANAPVRQRMLTCVREIADHWATSNPSASGGTGHRRDSPKNTLTNNMLAFWMTGDAQYETAYKRALREPMLLLEMAAGGTIGAYGIADWSGTNLGVTSIIALIELGRKLNTPWVALFEHAMGISYRFMHKYRMTLWSVAAAAYLGNAGAADEALWQLREFPYPKSGYAVDREIDPTFSYSPYPDLPWKLDWMQGGRRQALSTYPVFMRAANNFMFRSNPFNRGGGASNTLHPGADYLFGYWLARKYGVISPNE
jgi:hypothetical protein